MHRAQITKETLLQRLFSAFPGGWSGIALLLLRGVFATALLVQGSYYLREPNSSSATSFVGLVGIAAGTLLGVGFLTPFVGATVGLGAIGVGLSVLPLCTWTVFESHISAAFAAAILLAIIILGPGAFSIDARVFGRREIIIPPRPSPRQ